MVKTDEGSSYRQIIKATSIFGGVQVFNIVIAIVRSKAIALLLGPAGMGLVGLLTSALNIISSITNFGLGTSAVRNFAEAYEVGDAELIAKTNAVLRKLVWLTGLLGAFLTIFLSPVLSDLTFGNTEHTWSFVFLSISLFFSQLTVGKNVLLQGTRALKYLAFANMFGALGSLIVAIPLYYFFGENGIVPSIIIMSIVNLIVAARFSRKIKIKRVEVNFFEALKKGKGMIKLGLMLSLSGLVSLLISYIVSIYIRNVGCIEDVGLHNAGSQIVGSYVGLVFTAMGTDYYPRLSAVANDNKKRNDLVNQQGEIAVLILLPIILLFIVFVPFIVELLYSSKFFNINEMMIWSSFAMLFRAGSWVISFQFLAKGSSQLFFINELAINLLMLILNIIGYRIFGLTGLGYAYLLTYLIYIIQVFTLTKHHFGFEIHGYFIKTFVFSVFVCALSLIVVLNLKGFDKYLVGSLLIVGSSVFSIYQINSRTGILSNLKWKR